MSLAYVQEWLTVYFGARYFTDSFRNTIYAYDYDVSNGAVSNRRVVIDALAEGLTRNSFCDGFCVDTEGCIWSARFAPSLPSIHPSDKTDGLLMIQMGRFVHR